MSGAGVTIYLGPGWVLHLSTENGVQLERASHRTWRVGFVAAVRRKFPKVAERCDECGFVAGHRSGCSHRLDP